jgi:hypothetical protein
VIELVLLASAYGSPFYRTAWWEGRHPCDGDDWLWEADGGVSCVDPAGLSDGPTTLWEDVPSDSARRTPPIEWRNPFAEGALREVDQYWKHGVRDGTVVHRRREAIDAVMFQRYDDGELRFERHETSSGVPLMESHFRAHAPDGRLRMWQSGHLVWTGLFSSGEPVGHWRQWSPDGTLVQRIRYGPGGDRWQVVARAGQDCRVHVNQDAVVDHTSNCDDLRLPAVLPHLSTDDAW